MSKSDPNSAVFMEDAREDVERKIKKAFCPPQVRPAHGGGVRLGAPPPPSGAGNFGVWGLRVVTGSCCLSYPPSKAPGKAMQPPNLQPAHVWCSMPAIHK